MTDPAPTDPLVDPAIGYAEAVAELEQLLAHLERDDVDIDVLGTQVRRAAELIRLCRDRIAGARFDVEQIVADLASLTAAPRTDERDVVDEDDEDDEDDDDDLPLD